MTGNNSIQRVKTYLSEQFHLTPEQIESMFPCFITTLVTHMQSLENALAGNDLSLTGKAAHTMKGALLNLGMGECAEIAMLIEEKAKGGGEDSADFKKLIEELHTHLASVIN